MAASELAARLLAGDQRRAAAAEQVEHVLTGARRDFATTRRTPTMQTMIDIGWIEPAPDPYSRTEYIPGDNSLQLVHLAIWQGTTQGFGTDITLIEREIIRRHKALNLACVGFDPFQATMLATRLMRGQADQGCSVPMHQMNFTGDNLWMMASAVMTAFCERTIQLFPHPDLIADLKNLQIRETSAGFRFVSPRLTATATAGTKHGDAATALGIAVRVSQFYEQQAASRIEGPLVCWP